MPEHRPPPEECANCGAAIPRNAHACPECGADEEIGWREESVYDATNLPEDVWRDHDEYADGPSLTPRREVNGLAWYWWCVGVALLLLLGLGALHLLR